MSEKQLCWCGRELELIDHTHDDGLKSDYAPRDARIECLVHGKNWRLPQATVAVFVEAAKDVRAAPRGGDAWANVAPRTLQKIDAALALLPKDDDSK